LQNIKSLVSLKGLTCILYVCMYVAYVRMYVRMKFIVH